MGGLVNITLTHKISTTMRNHITNMAGLILMLVLFISIICQAAGKVVLWLVLSVHFRDFPFFSFSSVNSKCVIGLTEYVGAKDYICRNSRRPLDKDLYGIYFL